ncbi:MAG: hypothetical protein H6702_07505 [Myxococcales bacterium]|nr:hypothetical protein [Myxococcales bacterium]
MQALVIGVALVGAAWAQAPAFKVQQIGGAKVAVPAGWAVTQEAQPYPALKLEERPGAADSPSVVIFNVPAAQGAQAVPALAKALVEASMPKGATVLGQAPLFGGALVEYQGAITGIPAKLALLAVPSPQGGGVLAAFAAPTARYDALGGSRLLLTVISGQAPGTAAAAGPAGADAAHLKAMGALNQQSHQMMMNMIRNLDGREDCTPGTPGCVKVD